jgi:4-diphosphocytidyl-2-C-methyl-D-erythritol kinase
MPDQRSGRIVVCPPARRFEPGPSGGLIVRAPAKINLNLLVSPVGANGYHDLDSFVARIGLCDTIELRPRTDGETRLACDDESCGPAEGNLALRAAKALARGRDVPGADMTLHKAIPPGKGLGGGSSDAAAVLAGLDRLWRTSLPTGELVELAASIGSDVPLFLGPPAARMRGRGERLDAITVAPFAAMLILPRSACSTATVYRAFDRQPPPPAKQLDVALLAQPPSRWRDLLVNQLRPAAERVNAELAAIRSDVEARIDRPLCLTGSGSAMFALCDDADEARSLLDRVPDDDLRQAVVVRAIGW